jgi:23S rRNA (cytidine1920-2'-O)/16S rRNA (cytidine1409-2'-O)-methyltransferase
MTKERLDILVQRLTGANPSKAQGLIQTGQVVLPDGSIPKQTGLRLPEDTPLKILEQPRFVSRGGEKLVAAFEGFDFSVQDEVAMDVGASTGGFTDCLLQQGAAKVYAVDVGYGQLAWKLRQDPRVVVMERCNIRHLTADMLGERPKVFVADCSFISLRKILPPILALLAGEPRGVVLIKPQFEAERAQVPKGGVVRDSAVHDEVIERVTETARILGFRKIDVIPSPLTGPAGNREFLAYLREFQPD